jgi:hypothetical protein
MVERSVVPTVAQRNPPATQGRSTPARRNPRPTTRKVVAGQHSEQPVAQSGRRRRAAAGAVERPRQPVEPPRQPMHATACRTTHPSGPRRTGGIPRRPAQFIARAGIHSSRSGHPRPAKTPTAERKGSLPGVPTRPRSHNPGADPHVQQGNRATREDRSKIEERSNKIKERPRVDRTRSKREPARSRASEAKRARGNAGQHPTQPGWVSRSSHRGGLGGRPPEQDNQGGRCRNTEQGGRGGS